MQQKAGRRKFEKPFLRCVVGIAVVLLSVAAWWTTRYCRVEIAIHRFQSNPSQVRAAKLIALLEKYKPTRRQGARILKLLLWPKVATRTAYPVGRKPKVSAAIPFYLHFHTTMTCPVDVLAGGQSHHVRRFSTYFGTTPQVWSSPVAPDGPGKFPMELRFHYVLDPPREAIWFYFNNPVGRLLYRLRTVTKRQPGSPIPEERRYQARFSVPVDVNIVEEAKAERVQLLASPELDGLMRGAFSLTQLPTHSRESFGWRALAKRLPANAAFQYALELSDGTRVSKFMQGNHAYAYAGRDFEINLALQYSDLNGPGTYDGRLVFEPDPNCAFEEPTIKAIWNGTLEFPVQFTVGSEPETVR